MFFTQHVNKMLLVTGIGTAAAFAYAFFPQWAITHIGQLPYLDQDFVFYQHWGVMVGMMGVMMVGAAFKPQWRDSIMLYSAVEKGFMVILLLLNYNSPHITGFLLAGAMDTFVVIWTLAYWKEQKTIRLQASTLQH
ncbi:hypothetical protein [Vibrio sp. McD22-P3]|uniref:hypothetical protein n=1 Tax=Vibrio sp. McD22-P3 TaxID=2724880 RepID=UPI001F257D23|nr:hypothetical protein [Vibrio sp. McD22-P3]MCF4173134.1 hypothetical protein [Vibrio sp. McD22-P3]